MNQINKQYGFSLLEIILALSFIVVLSVSCLFGLSYVGAKTYMVTAMTSMRSDLHMLQQLSRSHHKSIVFCASENGYNCTHDWSKGRLAYYGNQATGVADDNRIFFHAAKMRDAHWVWRSSFAKNDRLIFGPKGDNLSQRGSFYYCTRHLEFDRRLIINQVGRIHTVVASCDGVM